MRLKKAEGCEAHHVAQSDAPMTICFAHAEFPMQDESIPEGLLCPISGEIFVDPVQAPDGYV